MATSTVDLTHGWTIFEQSNAGTTNGERFTLSKDATVTHLRAYAHGTTRTLTLSIYRVSDGARLTSGAVTVSANTWGQVDVADVALTAGTEYVLAAYGDNFAYGSGTRPTSHGHTVNDITVNLTQAVHSGTGDSFPSTVSTVTTYEYLLGMVLATNDPPATPTNLAPSGATGSTSVTLSATVSDPNSDTVSAIFEVTTDSTFASYTGTGSGSYEGTVVASGNTSTKGLTLAGGTYYLRARAKDAKGALSGLTAVQSFTTNRPPDAPTLGYPSGGQTIDRNSALRMSWTFSDPDSGDSQSKYDLRYRLTSTTAWTVVSATTTNTFRDFAAGTFAAGDYEWQVRTYDSLGEVGPYSASGFFTAADAPAGPTITDPGNGGVVNTNPYAVVWSAADQDAYQLRTVADSAGSPDTATVYTDTGTVEAPGVRTANVAFPVNGRAEHVQLRVRFDGLWSSWASNAVTVSYTAPATPSVTVLASSSEGAISVEGTHPAPSGSEPTVSGVDVYRRETAVGGGGIRIAANRHPDAVFIDYTPASGVDYEYALLALGSNGTSTLSAWAGGVAAAGSVSDYGGY
jgi:hypothetical protein